MSIENAVIVRNKTRLELLTERFNTQDQARFYIQKSQEVFKEKKIASVKAKSSAPAPKAEAIKVAEFGEYEAEHIKFYDVLDIMQRNLSKHLKVKLLDQMYLSTNIFTDKDLVFVLGQDGLVANTAKYVHGIPIIGVNPDPKRFDGVLLPFHQGNFLNGLQRVLSNTHTAKHVTLAVVNTNDNQRLLAFNDLYIGVSSHASARYQITYNGRTENHSSSGIIVSTGAGSSGWLSSLFNMANGLTAFFTGQAAVNPVRLPFDTQKLMFVVREPFISKTSQAGIVAGYIEAGTELEVESMMPQNGVIFSDGIQSDFIKFNSGTIATIGIAPEKAILVQN